MTPQRAPRCRSPLFKGDWWLAQPRVPATAEGSPVPSRETSLPVPVACRLRVGSGEWRRTPVARDASGASGASSQAQTRTRGQRVVGTCSVSARERGPGGRGRAGGARQACMCGAQGLRKKAHSHSRLTRPWTAGPGRIRPAAVSATGAWPESGFQKVAGLKRLIADCDSVST